MDQADEFDAVQGAVWKQFGADAKLSRVNLVEMKREE
jgi:hypothetical protein